MIRNLTGAIRKLWLLQTYRRVFDSPDGKKVLTHLASECFIGKSTFVAGDPHQSALNEGSRRVILSIIHLVNMDESNLVRMIEEQEKEKGSR